MKKLEDKRKELLKLMINSKEFSEGLNIETIKLLKKINKAKENYSQCIEDVDFILKTVETKEEFAI